MGLYIDLAVIVILLIFGVVGLCKGFFKSFLSLFGFFGAILVAVIFREQIAAVLNSMFGLQGKIASAVSVKLGEISPSLLQEVATKEEMVELLNASNLNSILKGIFGGLASSAIFTVPLSVSDLASTPIASLCVTAIGVVVLFVLIRILVLILNLTLGKLIKKGKVLGGLNKFLGFAFGILQGGVIVASLMAVVSVASLVPAVNNFVTTNMETTYVTKYGYDLVNDYIVEELQKLTTQAPAEETPPVIEGE